VADLSDVTAYLANAVASAVYPNGTSQPSVAPTPPSTAKQTFTNPADVRIYEGWPLPDQLDLDLGGNVLSGNPPVPTPRTNGPLANVSIYPLPGASGSAPYQILDKTYVIAAPTFGLSVSLSGTTITLTGTPNTGEFLTIVADREYVYSTGGVSAAAVLSALATAAEANYTGVVVTSDTLTIPAGISFEVRQGGTGLLGKVVHRERQAIMVTVWAPDHTTRSTLAKAIDVVLKESITVTMPDGSDAKIVYSRTNQTDEGQNVTAYRRDLIYDVEYATLQTYPGVSITSVQSTLTFDEIATPTPPAPLTSAT
jgi:hypothetical protein